MSQFTPTEIHIGGNRYDLADICLIYIASPDSAESYILLDKQQGSPSELNQTADSGGHRSINLEKKVQYQIHDIPDFPNDLQQLEDMEELVRHLTHQTEGLRLRQDRCVSEDGREVFEEFILQMEALSAGVERFSSISQIIKRIKFDPAAEDVFVSDGYDCKALGQLIGESERLLHLGCEEVGQLLEGAKRLLRLDWNVWSVHENMRYDFGKIYVNHHKVALPVYDIRSKHGGYVWINFKSGQCDMLPCITARVEQTAENIAAAANKVRQLTSQPGAGSGQAFDI